MLHIQDYGLNIDRFPNFFIEENYDLYKTLSIVVDKTNNDEIVFKYDVKDSFYVFLIIDAYLEYTVNKVYSTFIFFDKIDVLEYVQNNNQVNFTVHKTDYRALRSVKIFLE
jgi:hypothetical protein